MDLWVNPAGLWFYVLPAVSNPVGAADFPLPIPGGAGGVVAQFRAQFVWAGPTSPAPCPAQGLSASNALEFTIQP